jgi:hypothetical protein
MTVDDSTACFSWFNPSKDIKGFLIFLKMASNHFFNTSPRWRFLAFNVIPFQLIHFRGTRIDESLILVLFELFDNRVFCWGINV